jgi:hypothetical protein
MTLHSCSLFFPARGPGIVIPRILTLGSLVLILHHSAAISIAFMVSEPKVAINGYRVADRLVMEAMLSCTFCGFWMGEAGGGVVMFILNEVAW